MGILLANYFYVFLNIFRDLGEEWRAIMAAIMAILLANYFYVFLNIFRDLGEEWRAIMAAIMAILLANYFYVFLNIFGTNWNDSELYLEVQVSLIWGNNGWYWAGVGRGVNQGGTGNPRPTDQLWASILSHD